MPKARWIVAGSCVAALAVAGVVVAAASGSGGGGQRALSSEEANRLAITRFRNYEAGGRAVTISVPGPAGNLIVTGSVDYRAKLGYGVVHGTGRDTSSDGLIEWTATSVRVDPVTDAPATAPAIPPTTGWYSRPLQQTGSSLDSSLLIALSLGSDRPDNAQLLPQNGAGWAGHDQVAGRQVDIMTGPAANGSAGTAGTVRYWIGSDGTMYRVQAALASETQPAVIDFDTQKYTPMPSAPATAPSR
ncbi:hypothetical protein [Catenulispora subtropica]|uniref:Uncharacterized protein n=1 Tax=Catenulispora subtropica TaxID=450798 RepID=A0ABN2R962_9ACTN